MSNAKHVLIYQGRLCIKCSQTSNVSHMLHTRRVQTQENGIFLEMYIHFYIYIF